VVAYLLSEVHLAELSECGIPDSSSINERHPAKTAEYSADRQMHYHIGCGLGVAYPKYAEESATLRSHQRASSSPPATAGPEIAAMTGLESCIRVTLF
jgi:hypothetical protein